VQLIGLDGCRAHQPRILAPTVVSIDTVKTPAAVQPIPKTARALEEQCRVKDLVPSRAGFLDEVLFAEPTARTPLFNDYTRDSYHVRKLDLIEGLQRQSASCGLSLRAVLIVGPVGMLWAYHVAVLIDEDDQVRINSLVMPHARVTGKGTALVAAAPVSDSVRELIASSLIRPGIPTPAPTLTADDTEFSYRLLLATFDGARPAYFHANFDDVFPSPDGKALLDRANRILGQTSRTYPRRDARQEH
jgi:hypothetical protein